MSLKTGVMGISLSLAVSASLVGNLVFFKELNETNRVTTTNIETLSQQIEKKISSSKGDTSFNDGDSELISDRLSELENQLLSLSEEVGKIPDFVQLNKDGEASNTTTEAPAIITAPEVVQTAPTLTNPVFKTNAKLNFRSGASLASPIQKTFAVGETLTWVENAQQVADGYTWIKVVDSAGTYGWVAQKYTIQQ